MISAFDKLISLISSKVPMKNSTDNNVNCDNYYETGIYYLGSGLTNAPAEYIKLIVVGANKAQKGDVAQIAIAVSSGSVYIRTGNFSSSEQTIWWHNWITVYQNIVTGTPFETGRTIDGKKEYGKRINVGPLTSGTLKTVDSGINSTNYTLTGISGSAYSAYNGRQDPIPNSNIEVGISGNLLRVTSNATYNHETSCYVNIYYTIN